MEKINGTNLGNWLVLEKWMSPFIFEGTDAEDETWLARLLPAEELASRLKAHRETYVTEEDFAHIASHGMNLVRIPVPYFIFGDRPPFVGCLEYLDRALDWAQKYRLKVLIDLHTAPGSQNGYDNGGITGVCKWCRDEKEVAFVLTVLERLAQRYAGHPALFGIEALNEPISFSVYMTAPSTGKARDRKEAKGSGHVPMSFLKAFYIKAYTVLRKYLKEDQAIVFHDGFRLGRWGSFFVQKGMKNVMLDTHIYIFAMENFVPVHEKWVYRLYMGYNAWLIGRANRYTPVVVGEWCISNRKAQRFPKGGEAAAEEERRRIYRDVAAMQLKVWNRAAGHIYWSYQLYRDRKKRMEESWKNGWDLCRCWRDGWMPQDERQDAR